MNDDTLICRMENVMRTTAEDDDDEAQVKAHMKAQLDLGNHLDDFVLILRWFFYTTIHIVYMLF